MRLNNITSMLDCYNVKWPQYNASSDGLCVSSNNLIETDLFPQNKIAVIFSSFVFDQF